MADKKTPPQKKDADNMAPGYEVTVSGQYYSVNENGNKSPKTYKPQKFQFPKIVSYKKGVKKEYTEHEDGSKTSRVVPDVVPANALNIALHLVKNFHIIPRLKQEYDDFAGLRTCAIFSKEEILIDTTKIKDVSEKDIQNMDEAEIRQFVTINDITVSFSNYSDIADLKNAVIQAMAQKNMDASSRGVGAEMTEEELLLQEPKSLFS